MKPTLLLDESEELFEIRTKSERIQQIKQIFNSGYQKGAYVVRFYQDKKTGKYKKQKFYTYCPKIFASIRSLEPVLADRCLNFNLTRSKNPYTLRTNELTELMHEILAYSIKNYVKIINEIPKAKTQLIKNKIYGRTQELLLPLIAISNHFKKDILTYSIKLAEKRKQKETSLQLAEQMLIQALYNIFELKNSEEDYIDLYTIKDEMKKLFDKEQELKWLTNHYLGQLMSRLGFDETARRGTTGRTHYLIRKQDISKLIYAYNVEVKWHGKTGKTETIQTLHID